MRFLTLAKVATFLGCLTTSLTNAQVAVESGMTSDSYCDQSQMVCLTGLYSPSTKMINYTLVIQKGEQQVGWYGIGQGTQMVGANMAVNWINSDNSLTTSHRSTNAQVQPLENEVTVQSFSINKDVSKTSSGQTVWSWNMPLPSQYPMSAVQHVLAVSSTSPSSSSSSATIVKHYYTNTGIELDLTKAYNGSSPAGITGSTQTVSTDSTDARRDLDVNYTRLYLVHMIFMILGWQLCFPIGILLARYGRTMFTWFPAHRAIQSVGFVFVFIAFFLAVAAVGMQKIPHFGTTHQKLGLALFILLIVQVILGAGSHSLKQRKGLRHLGFIHIPLGLLIFALSVWNIHEGFEVWQWEPPAYASYIIYAWAGLMALLYFIGFIFLRKELKQTKHHSEKPLNGGLDSPSERNSA